MEKTKNKYTKVTVEQDGFVHVIQVNNQDLTIGEMTNMFRSILLSMTYPEALVDEYIPYQFEG